MTNTHPQVDTYIAELKDWRGDKIAQLRQLIHQAHPPISEQWKWDVPVYTAKKMVCATSAFKDHVKINFFHGAKLSDVQHLFNSGLESKSHRSINFTESDAINEAAVLEIINAAIIHDQG
jgi:hypothetical protein